MRHGNWGEVGEDIGQIQYAVIEAVLGTKGAGLALKGIKTGAQAASTAVKGLIGAQRLAQIAAKSSQVFNRIKFVTSDIVKTGQKNIPPLESSKAVVSNVATNVDEAFLV